jgi:hypothetical protein
MKYTYIAIGITSWCGLGFVRGINDYKYNNINKSKPFMYSSLILFGFIGTIVYANPILFPLLVSKEIYRLEVDIRKLENEKKSYFYNSLL